MVFCHRPELLRDIDFGQNPRVLTFKKSMNIFHLAKFPLVVALGSLRIEFLNINISTKKFHEICLHVKKIVSYCLQPKERDTFEKTSVFPHGPKFF